MGSAALTFFVFETEMLENFWGLSPANPAGIQENVTPFTSIQLQRLNIAPTSLRRASKAGIRQLTGKLLITKERETGIEPATSSLGIWT
jgi:hypothetical protein